MQHHVELDARFGWRATDGIELPVSGANLLHSRHAEFPQPYGEQITRSVLAEARWRF
jgi:hypothetical protein